ncbi:MBL fold metallo-hydrolase [Nonomuraea sp. NPDC047529]|uniref:MBL fold metallo-hydrolase n=1 Tax=Nonomuraea sp. NPDC047529 TaxID=3155623 RepID=UPI0033D5D3BB
MKLASHLHRLGNDIVACYLVDTAEGITLIDAGLPGHWRDLQRELRSLGKSVNDIRGLVLTHGDSDHIGFAERLRSAHGVPVFVHAADAVRTRTGEKPKVTAGPIRPGPTLDSLDRIAGLPASWVLPGHGAPWRTSPDRVRQAVQPHPFTT